MKNRFPIMIILETGEIKEIASFSSVYDPNITSPAPYSWLNNTIPITELQFETLEGKRYSVARNSGKIAIELQDGYTFKI